MLDVAHLHFLESHSTGCRHSKWMSRSQDPSQRMYQLDQRAAFQSAYPQYSGIDAIRQDHQYMSCVFCIIFYTANNGKISVFRIVLYGIPCLAALIAVMIRDHKSIVSQFHKTICKFCYRNLGINGSFLSMTM